MSKKLANPAGITLTAPGFALIRKKDSVEMKLNSRVKTGKYKERNAPELDLNLKK